MRARDAWQAAPLVVAASLFLWMYLATAGLDEAADGGAFGPATPELLRDVRGFGHEWRHGQTGWPIYVPGFLLTGVAVAPLFRATLWRLVASLIGALCVGWIVAASVAATGAKWLADDFAAREGLALPDDVGPANPLLAYPAAATFVAFSLLVGGAGRAIAYRRWWMLGTAAAAYVVVTGIRGSFTFGHLASTWAGRVADGDATAIVSLLVAVGIACGLAWFARRPAYVTASIAEGSSAALLSRTASNLHS